MINTFFATKLKTAQTFDDKGNRLVITKIMANPLTVTQIKSFKKDGYWSVQCAFGKKSKKSLSKALLKHLKKAKLKTPPKFIREIKVLEKPTLKVGDQIKVSDTLKPDDKVKISGTSKGRGFAGVMKRWGFAGGPRTHGQSDRPRSIGSIGPGTDPGRVWKGKKMPGRFGTDTVTVKNLQVLEVNHQTNILTIKGTVPGHTKSLLKITKYGNSKNPIKLYQKPKAKTKNDKPKPKKNTQ
ncbi:MAG: 50S ribosomal protein L3 [Patescibacteria group bacterium]|nr:50S ribosomal protein L3 [Patescibacteria group bacterium]